MTLTSRQLTATLLATFGALSMSAQARADAPAGDRGTGLAHAAPACPSSAGQPSQQHPAAAGRRLTSG